jgi:hypothetical protein
MNQNAQRQPSRIVLVVGLDLSELSEHLLAKARDLAAWADEAQLNVVHVVPPHLFASVSASPSTPKRILGSSLSRRRLGASLKAYAATSWRGRLHTGRSTCALDGRATSSRGSRRTWGPTS